MKQIVKVRHIFTKEDFKGAGHYLVRTEESRIDDDGYLSTLVVKVGYLHTNDKSIHNNYCLVSMSDGWVQEGYFVGQKKQRELVKFNSLETLVNWLNHVSEQKFRMATRDEVIRAVSCQKHRSLETLGL